MFSIELQERLQSFVSVEEASWLSQFNIKSNICTKISGDDVDDVVSFAKIDWNLMNKPFSETHLLKLHNCVKLMAVQITCGVCDSSIIRNIFGMRKESCSIEICDDRMHVSYVHSERRFECAGLQDDDVKYILNTVKSVKAIEIKSAHNNVLKCLAGHTGLGSLKVNEKGFSSWLQAFPELKHVSVVNFGKDTEEFVLGAKLQDIDCGDSHFVDNELSIDYIDDYDYNQPYHHYEGEEEGKDAAEHEDELLLAIIRQRTITSLKLTCPLSPSLCTALMEHQSDSLRQLHIICDENYSEAFLIAPSCFRLMMKSRLEVLILESDSYGCFGQMLHQLALLCSETLRVFHWEGGCDDEDSEPVCADLRKLIHLEECKLDIAVEDEPFFRALTEALLCLPKLEHVSIPHIVDAEGTMYVCDMASYDVQSRMPLTWWRGIGACVELINDPRVAHLLLAQTSECHLCIEHGCDLTALSTLPLKIWKLCSDTLCPIPAGGTCGSTGPR